MRSSCIDFLSNLALLLLVLTFKTASSAPEAALVETLPGFHGSFPSKHYAGYVTLGGANGKKLYYYFVESENNPSTDPVVLWLNGGPGCSSFDGFVYENGPFNFEAGKEYGSLPTLHLNPYSWSKVSSVLYLDSTAGVGYSYSGNESDYITGDSTTASDSHIFLLKWFELYPEFLSNPFYVSGESYAGIYIPTLAYAAAQGTDAGVKPEINLKGYLVGDGVADMDFDGNSLVPFAHGMGLISDELFEVRSGDHDMCIPFKGTEAWTRSIGYRIVDKWRPWIVDNQVAGYIQGYDYNLTFMTVKGAGHAVPEYKPRESLEFYSRWLAGLRI